DSHSVFQWSDKKVIASRGPLFTCFLSALFISNFSLAAGIMNGDFATGDFSGWSQDTDGFSPVPPPNQANDFSIVGASGDYAARIEADYWTTPGDISSVPLDDVFIANTLYQVMDTTTAVGSGLQLSFDWRFDGEDGDLDSGEIFTVGLSDSSGSYFDAGGGLGFLIDPTTTYGDGTFMALLDASTFANEPGWSLNFQIEVGVDPASFEPNGQGSFVQIDNVLLQMVAPAVPEPGLLLLVGLGLIGYLGFRRTGGSRVTRHGSEMIENT
ncbi:MAG: PEP-CTERM sorting domain-containing protein, partial [Gammaproteobacteria bacterium]|nr:PEP-CTERM sorting domain-containing protein [Gammaproteobacteria bacterium]